MAGVKNLKKKLNYTLLKIITVLNENKINNWFIGYGTLLGIIRENSCIENDDDIDILCNQADYDNIRNIFIKNNFNFTKKYNINDSKYILKTIDTNDFCSVDFYFCNIENNGDFNDKWNKVIWSNCYKNNELIEYNWFDNKLYIPNNYEEKLINRYGKNWKIPENSKGVKPIKNII
jgi:phosphorylcholine metabolism protein LicD